MQLMRMLVLELGLVAGVVIAGCGPKNTGDEAANDASSEDENSSESESDEGKVWPDFGTSEYCAGLTEEECLDAFACSAVGGTILMPIGVGDGWCEGTVEEYLGCIDRSDRGCGVEFVCGGEQTWRIETEYDCVPPGYEACDAEGPIFGPGDC